MPRTHRSRQESRDRGVLIVLCGPSHSGKSTFARRCCKGFTIVSSDKIRKKQGRSFSRLQGEGKVWEIFESEKRAALRRGHDVVLDACHISERARWHALRGPNAHHRKVCIVFDLPLETIRERCLKDGRLSLKEAERMWRAFQDSKPSEEELKDLGFDKVHSVEGG